MESVSSFSSIEDTATTFHIASYAYAILNTYTCIRNAAALPE